MISFVLGWPWVLRLTKSHSRVSRAWPMWSLLAQGSSNVSGPCLRQRYLALELIIVGSNDMWMERSREMETEEPGDDSNQGHFTIYGCGIFLRSTITPHTSLRLDALVCAVNSLPALSLRVSPVRSRPLCGQPPSLNLVPPMFCFCPCTMSFFFASATLHNSHSSQLSCRVGFVDDIYHW